MKSYLKVSPYTEGSLFCHLNCTCLTRYQFVSIIHGALKFLGYCTANTNTHSFRIAAATYLALKGESDETIKQKGRWPSNSYQRYIIFYLSVSVFTELQAHLYKGHRNIQKDDQRGQTLPSKDLD